MPFPRKCPKCKTDLTVEGNLDIYGSAHAVDAFINPEFDLLDDLGSPDWNNLEWSYVHGYQCSSCSEEIYNKDE
jgi:hypothetical protein